MFFTYARFDFFSYQLKKINDAFKKNKKLNDSIDEADENDPDNTSSPLDDSSLESEDSSLQYEKFNCFYLYKKYIKEIYIRMKQFKDELLASCLELMLSLPKELIVLNLNEVFEALQVIHLLVHILKV